MNRRPISVTVIACLYFATGALGFVYHASEFTAGQPFRFDLFGIELIRIAAVVCAVFMLRGHNWARWLALVWMGFHVVLSAFHDLGQLAVHCLFFAVIVWFLTRMDARRFFHAVP